MAVNSSTWPKTWDSAEMSTGTPALWIIGTFGKLRFHTVTTPSALHRFMACEVIVKHAFERKYNNYGNEINPILKKPETSPLRAIPSAELKQITKIPDGLMPASALPQEEDRIELWAEPDTVKLFKTGEGIVIKTNGGFMFKWIQPNSGDLGTFKGDGADLMNRVSARTNAYDTPDVLAHEQLEGCGEDEWSD